MPKTDELCTATFGGTQCDATTEVLTFCRIHWAQQNRGAPFTPRKHRRPRGMARVRDEHGRKQCTRCEEWRPVEEYRPAIKTADGLQSWCSPCSCDYMTLNRYGLTRADVLRIVSEQGGCGICGTDKPRNEGFRNGWHVDHDHNCCPSDRTCGRCIRGVLCADCNKLIGLAHDSVLRLQQAVSYLRDCEDAHERND